MVELHSPHIFVRSWRLENRDGETFAEMEDNMHHFRGRLSAKDGKLASMTAEALRYPFSTCPGACEKLDRLVGLAVPPAANLPRDERPSHCTHLLDMSNIAGRHALRGENATLRFDARIEMELGFGLRSARLCRDGREVLRWEMNDTEIIGPAAFAGLDLFASLPKWGYANLRDDALEDVNVLTRATHIGRNTLRVNVIMEVENGAEIVGMAPTCHSNQQGDRALVIKSFYRRYENNAELFAS